MTGYSKEEIVGVIPIKLWGGNIPFEEKRMQDIRQTESVYYFVKSNIALNDLVEKVLEQLETPY